MKRLILLLTLLILLPTASVSAQDIEQASTELKTSPVLITGYQADSSGFEFVQIYNNSSQIISLDGWQLAWTLTDENDNITNVKIPLQNWLPGEQYAIVAEHGMIDGADIKFTLNNPNNGVVGELKIIPPADKYAAYTVKGNLFDPGRYTMEPTTAGNFTISRPFVQATEDAILYGNGLYTPPKNTGLKIVEILGNPRHCSPEDASYDLTCNDYVKLQNPTNKPIVLDFYRLRLGWGNDNASLTNSIALSETLEPGGYYTVALRDDEQPLSITASGGYVWLEDFYGITKYLSTTYKYPDLGGEAYRGFSWAIGNSEQWLWGVPSPGAANNFSRQPEIKQTSSELKPCAPRQERNPTTNRCRSMAASTSTLKPCKVGQERNPVTNRCRNLEAASSLKPCQPGQERNPETNRCRKVAGASTDLPEVQDIQSTPDNRNYRWWIVGSVAAGAATFGAWEWRRDIAAWIARLKTRGSPPS